MPDLTFSVVKAEAIPFAASPQMAFQLRIRQTPAGGQPLQIHSIALRCQIRIEPAQRRYAAEEKEHLHDLFDVTERWNRTLKSLLWTHANVNVPGFVDETLVDLPVPCTFDFNVATTKYFNAIEDGEVPLTLLFSGTIFHEVPDTGLQIVQIPWEKEASFRMPVRVWKDMMELYYPNTAWLCLRKDVFDRLERFKTANRLTSWELALDNLLTTQEQAAR